MRRVVLTLAAFAVVGLATSLAHAGHGSRGSSVSFYYYQPYRPMTPYYSSRGRGGYGFHMDTHAQAVRRIKATHSRWRYNTHPRSLQNGPPHPYDYYGW